MTLPPGRYLGTVYEEVARAHAARVAAEAEEASAARSAAEAGGAAATTLQATLPWM